VNVCYLRCGRLTRFSEVKMEVGGLSKTLVVVWHFRWCYFSEDCSLNIQVS
jgi:hypothetical protein